MGIMTTYTPDIHSLIPLEGGLSIAFGLILVLGCIGVFFGFGTYLFDRLVMVNKAFDELSVELFKAHWVYQDAHMGVETDYHCLEQAFQNYFYNERIAPQQMVKQLSMVLVIQALQGKLTLTPTLVTHLQTRMTTIQAVVDDLLEDTASPKQEPSGRYGDPYAYVMTGEDIGTVDMDVVVLPQNPNWRLTVQEHKATQRQKAMALVLAEVLSFGVEAQEKIS